jgi:hypothetical protein
MPAPALYRTDDDLFAPRALLGWVGFSLAAGCACVGALLACRDVASGAAGPATDLGGQPLVLAGALVLAALTAGATAANLAAQTWDTRREFGFALPLLLAFVALAGVAFAGRAGAFGAFGGPAGGAGSPAGLALLGAVAAAIGLLHSSVARATSNAIRATPSAGAASDLAANLVRAALGAADERARELRWALLRAVELVAFVAGGAFAAASAGRLQYDLFLVPAGLLIFSLGLTAAPSDEAPEAAQAAGPPEAVLFRGVRPRERRGEGASTDDDA